MQYQLMIVGWNAVQAKLKMYIVLRPELSVAAAVVAAAHASLGTYLQFETDPLMQEWRHTSFVKIILKAINLHQFQACRNFGAHRVFTESTLENLEVSVGFNIVVSPHPHFKDIPKWTEG